MVEHKCNRNIWNYDNYAYVSVFTDNDLTHITEDYFEIKLIARLLDQICVVQPPMFPPRCDDAPPQEYEYSQPHMSTDYILHHLLQILQCSTRVTPSLDLYRFKIILTNHITLKLFPFLLTNRKSMKSYSFLWIGKKEIITTGIFTRVDYLRINE